MRQKTLVVKKAQIKRNWHLVDVGGKVLGDVIPGIARILMGKTKSDYTPNIDGGDYVVVINVKNVVVTGKKRAQKMYYHHSGFPGGLKSRSFEEVMANTPELIIKHAVKGMLPENKLLRTRMNRLKVFVDGEHTYKEKFAK